MNIILYASLLGSLMYAQVYTYPYIAFFVGVCWLDTLGDLGMSHLKAAKKVMRYLLCTKDHMLTYQ